MPEITVIVAAFNDEKHLPECLDSLTEQTLHDIQIVCTDDGSTDRTGRIMDQYAARDKRIEVIHFDHNQGMSKARNAALNAARGRYIAFLDSDDWMSDDALEKIADTFARHPLADTVLLNVMMCQGNRQAYKGHLFKGRQFERLTGQEAFELSLDWSIHGIYATRSELYRRFPYDDSCYAYSDENTTRAHYLFSREVYPCNGTYFYRRNPDSITNRISSRRFMILRADESLKKSMEEWNAGERIATRFENIRWARLVDTCLFYHLHSEQLTESERKEGLKEMRHAWATIDRTKISKTTLHKFGYCPMPCWTLFRMQEWLYFTLRGCLGRNKEQ